MRIGTAPDKGDILWSDALADGKRRRLGGGNTGHNRIRTFNANYWPEGKIYVSLQVVDDNGKGSSFSEYTVLEKKSPSVGFAVTRPDITAINDTVTLRILSPSSASYEWDCDGGSIISQDATSVSLKWEKAALKKVKLMAVGKSGNKSEFIQEVEVVPARLERSDYDCFGALDMDGDGNMELLIGNQFWEGDANGVYTPVKRLFNSNLPGLNSTVADVNKDGRPDIFSKNYQLVNEGDKSMDIREIKSTQAVVCDLDNDGFMDASSQYRNSGNYIDFIEVGSELVRYNLKYYDYDNDGLVDVIGANYDKKFVIYKNHGDFRFSLLEDFEYYDFAYSNRYYEVGDIDGNGKADFAWSNAKMPKGMEKLHIRWDNGDFSDIDAPAGYHFSEGIVLFDFDNNGTLDLFQNLTPSGEGSPVYAHAIIYFNPDRTWNMVTYPNNGNGIVEPIISNGSKSQVVYHRTDGRLGYNSEIIRGPSNTPPTAPANIRVKHGDEYLVIEWDPASDAENPSTALKYNISIKHKDKEGDGAYFISPLNYGRDGVHVPTNTRLINGTKFTIPINVIPNGTYEIKVQALDTQWQESEFSDVYEYTLGTSPFFSIPEETMVGKETTIRMRSGLTADDVDFGRDAKLISAKGDQFSVCWTTEGDKVISCEGYEAHIFVHPALDASFSLPEALYYGDRIRIDCDCTHNSSWSWRRADPAWWDFEPMLWALSRVDDHQAELMISEYLPEEKIEIKHTLTEDYGVAEYSCIVDIQSHPEPIRISKILFDQETKKFVLHWEVPKHLINLISGIKVWNYRDLIAVLPTDARSFMDMSDHVGDYSYYIQYIYPNGESIKGDPAHPLFLRVRLDENDNWKLDWTLIYDCNFECIRIMRGSTLEDMQPIDYVEPDLGSYTDFNTSSKQYYYGIDALMDKNDPQSVCYQSPRRQTPAHPAGLESLFSEDDCLRIKYEGHGDLYRITGIPDGGGKSTIIDIYNLNGISLFHDQFDTSSATIDLGNLPEGVYILKATGINSSVTEKFIKSKQ